MKTFFYYYRTPKIINDNGKVSGCHPAVTVCLVTDEASFARGVSIWDGKDPICKKEGRRRARARAMKALGTKKNSEHVVTDRAINNIAHLPYIAELTLFGIYFWKSEFNPELTEKERSICDNRKT